MKEKWKERKKEYGLRTRIAQSSFFSALQFSVCVFSSILRNKRQSERKKLIKISVLSSLRFLQFSWLSNFLLWQLRKKRAFSIYLTSINAFLSSTQIIENIFIFCCFIWFYAVTKNIWSIISCFFAAVSRVSLYQQSNS